MVRRLWLSLEIIIVYTSGDKLMRMNKETGVVDSVVGQRAGTNSYAIQPVTYADGMIFSAFNGGFRHLTLTPSRRCGIQGQRGWSVCKPYLL